MKVHVAVPAYDGKVCVETARALLNELGAGLTVGVEIEVAFSPGCSLVTIARNQAVRAFLESDADRMVFLDADVSWAPGALIRLAQHPVEFVGGAYRHKQEPESYPVGWILPDPANPPPLLSDPETGLIEVEAVPGGFMALSRNVFDRFAAHHGDRGYTHFGEAFYAYFTAPFRDGRLYGEDTAFCHDWRAAGGQVWLDPYLKLTHHGGSNAYAGCIGEWLLSRPT